MLKEAHCIRTIFLNKNAHILYIVSKKVLRMPRISHIKFDCIEGCTVEATLSLIGGKWKGVILYRLLTENILRFNELRRLLPKVTQRMLTNQLRELEECGLVNRKVYAQVPPKVEYSLSEYGKTLTPVILALKEWGDQHIAQQSQSL